MIKLKATCEKCAQEIELYDASGEVCRQDTDEFALKPVCYVVVTNTLLGQCLICGCAIHIEVESARTEPGDREVKAIPG